MNNQRRLVIIGASGHGKVVADIAFLDDGSETAECAGFPVIGKVSDAASISDGSDFIVAIGNSKVRKKIQDKLDGPIATLIHPDAVIGRGVEIGKGSVVMVGAVINPYARIGEGCIINTCASIDHNCVVDDFVHISVGSHLAGMITIGNGTWVGIGATISNNISVCNNCMIGAGAVVIRDIEEPGTYVGIPAKAARRD